MPTTNGASDVISKFGLTTSAGASKMADGRLNTMIKGPCEHVEKESNGRRNVCFNHLQ